MSKSCYGCQHYQQIDNYFGECKYGGCMEAMEATRQKAIPASGGILVEPDETELEITA